MRVSLTAASLVVVLGTAAFAADWPQWQGPDSDEGVQRNRPAEGVAYRGSTRRLDGHRTRDPATARWRLPGIACTSRVPSAATAASSPSTGPMARSSGRRSWVSPRERQGRWTARHAHRRRRSPLRAHRERRPGRQRRRVLNSEICSTGIAVPAMTAALDITHHRSALSSGQARVVSISVYDRDPHADSLAELDNERKR